MRLSPLVAVAAACILSLTACSDDSDDPKSSDSPSATGSPTGKDGKASESPDLGSGEVCEALDADAVGEIVGNEVESSQLSENNCTFTNADDPAATSVAIAEISVEAAGGSKTVRKTFQTMLAGDADKLPGVGDRAYLVVTKGRAGGGASASGAFMLGDDLVQVSVAPGGPLTEADARQQAIDLMKLAVQAL